MLNHIFTSDDLYKWAKENVTGITLFYMTQKGMEAHVLTLTDRLQYAESVPGTHRRHEFVPINSSELKIYLSSDTQDVDTKVSATVQTRQLDPVTYGAAAYDIVCITADMLKNVLLL
jgi:hypothetical protein